ncbi:amino acid adenylation domain-containing protein [Streptomyces sp. NPDC058295]|uniref:non-ribosomal peptide synthetase n=1 Tax=Streptomyces sp. NPDC058295 TaxID=3346431 RepID=UPI0036E6373B
MPVPRDPWIRCSAADRQVIEELQGRERPVAADKIVRGLWDRYRSGGGQIAVTDGDRQWTYDDLGKRVFALAHALTETYGLRSAPPRNPVFGVALDRSADLIQAVHAVALTGSAYCPLGPADPVAWQRTVVETAQTVAVIAGDTPDDGEPFDTVFRIDPPDTAAQGPGPADFAPAPLAADALSQIIFTSGSTGRPKGVMCTHRGFTNRIEWMQRCFPLSADDRVALKTPSTFDVSGWELFWPQYAGARTVVVPPGAHTSPEALIEIFNRHGVTVAHFVPSMLRMWLRVSGGRRCPTLRRVFSSGEALDAALVSEFRRQTDAELHNLYGPTEAAIDVTHFRADAEERPTVPIGRPITNTRLYVLDPNGLVCPVGERGEIHIQGIGVAVGYRGATEEDATRFVPVLPGAPAGWGSFRTGDLGSYTADGQIEFHGRIDDQVKIRGQRVEPGEVEAVLRGHDAVLEACVRPHAAGSGRTLLVAYAVVAPEFRMTDVTGELIAYLADRLPARSLPSRIVLLDALPIGRHGKIDADRLPAPGRARPDITPAFQEPTEPMEELIADIWGQVLDLDEVGVHDNFHDLGGDSLAAVEISFLLTERLGLAYDDPLVPRVLMDGDTVAKSAAVVAAAGGAPCSG